MHFANELINYMLISKHQMLIIIIIIEMFNFNDDFNLSFFTMKYIFVTHFKKLLQLKWVIFIMKLLRFFFLLILNPTIMVTNVDFLN